jgi:hypothetical protein
MEKRMEYTLYKEIAKHKTKIKDLDLGRMANLKLVDKRVKELVELKLQVLVEVRTSSG